MSNDSSLNQGDIYISLKYCETLIQIRYVLCSKQLLSELRSQWFVFLTSCYLILETFFFILFQESLHTISLEIYVVQSLSLVHYLLDETLKKAYMCNMHVFNLQRFERGQVYTRDELLIICMHLSAVNLHDWCPSSISTPKTSHVTENGQWLRINKKGNHTTYIGSFESK